MNNKEKLRVVVVKPNRKPYVKWIDDSVIGKMKAVKGIVCRVPFDEDTDIYMNLNFHSKLKRVNREIYDNEGMYREYIKGTFFIASKKDTESENISLTEEQIEKYIRQFEPLQVYGCGFRERVKAEIKEELIYQLIFEGRDETWLIEKIEKGTELEIESIKELMEQFGNCEEDIETKVIRDLMDEVNNRKGEEIDE